VTPAEVVTTVAGLAGSVGSLDGTGSTARFQLPSGVVVDGNYNVYVADQGNNTIRKVRPTGEVTTLAGLAGGSGSADGTGSAARFSLPFGLVVDNNRNVYVADTHNHTIRKATPAGEVTTLAGLAGSSGSADGARGDARFSYPYSVAVDDAGNLYVADQGNHTVRKVSPAGEVATLAGLAANLGSVDGTGSGARFYFPHGVAVDRAGNFYVADTQNNTIRKGYPPMLLNSSFNGGQFGFSPTGPEGRLAVVEGSMDLVNWLPLWTNTFTGNLNFIDPQSGAFPNRFYRAHLP
jgi:streptogramin lyase